MSGRIAQVVERPPLDREVRGSNPSHDTMALLLGPHYEFPQCGTIKGKIIIIKLLLLLIIIKQEIQIQIQTLSDHVCEKNSMHYISFCVYLHNLRGFRMCS
jgi:hypothetical protein